MRPAPLPVRPATTSKRPIEVSSRPNEEQNRSIAFLIWEIELCIWAIWTFTRPLEEQNRSPGRLNRTLWKQSRSIERLKRPNEERNRTVGEFFFRFMRANRKVRIHAGRTPCPTLGSDSSARVPLCGRCLNRRPQVRPRGARVSSASRLRDARWPPHSSALSPFAKVAGDWHPDGSWRERPPDGHMCFLRRATATANMGTLE